MPVLRFRAAQGVEEREISSRVATGTFNAVSAPQPRQLIDIDVDAGGVDDAVSFMDSLGYELLETDPAMPIEFAAAIEAPPITVKIRNETGLAILEGTLVASAGFSVPNGAYLIVSADKDDPARRPAFAVTQADIPDGENGTGIVFGVLIGVDTSAYAVTDQLVLGNNGAFSRPPPDVDPFTGEVQGVGQVIRVSVADGAIQINLESLLPVSAAGVFGLEQSLDRGVQTGFTVTRGGGLDLDVSAGVGFVTSGGVLSRLVFAGGTIALPANVSRYIYVDSNGVIQLSTSLPDLAVNLVLANARSNASDIIYVSTHFIPTGNAGQRGHVFAAEVIGPVVNSGAVATINGGDPLGIDVDGSVFYVTGNRKVVPATVGIGFVYWYRNGSGGQTLVTGQTQIDPDNYDDGSGVLAAVPAGRWKKDALYLANNSDGTGVEYHVVYAQETFGSQSEAEAGSMPVPADDLRMFALRVAGVVSQEGAAGITSIVDERPFLGQLSTGTTSATDHGLLGGLADDDHPQYQLRSEKNASGGYAGLDVSGAIAAAQHGAQGGGSLHAVAVAAGAAGFLSGADKSRLNALNTAEVFFAAETAANFLNSYRSRTVGAAASFRFNFYVPADFNALVAIELIGVPAATNAAANIDLVSEYGAVGEGAANHTQTDTTSTYALVANVLKAISLAGIFSSLAAGDLAGVSVSHTALGGSVDYLGIRLRYTRL